METQIVSEEQGMGLGCSLNISTETPQQLPSEVEDSEAHGGNRCFRS